MKKADIQGVDMSTAQMVGGGSSPNQRHVVYVITWLVELSCNGCTYMESFASDYTTQYYDELGGEGYGRRSRLLLGDVAHRDAAAVNRDDKKDKKDVLHAYKVIERLEKKLKSVFSTNSEGSSIEITDALIKIVGRGDGDNGQDCITTATATENGTHTF